MRRAEFKIYFSTLLTLTATIIINRIIVDGHTQTITKDTESAEFEYGGPKGPNYWSRLFPRFCNGSHQSPVNIIIKNTVPLLAPKMLYFNYHIPPRFGYMSLLNSGNSVVFKIDPSGGVVPSIHGAGLNNIYILDSFHFHYGKGFYGSEHLVNGGRFPIEIHLVHYREDYGSVANARTHSDGLAVLGVLTQVSQLPNIALKPLLNAINTVPLKDNVANVGTTFSIGSFLPFFRQVFYQYKGSLTTPTCDESVSWFVLQSRIGISKTQLRTFRNLRESVNRTDSLMYNHYRPVQPLNERKVFRVNAIMPNSFTLG